jgi:uncharacterized membrane protein
MGEPESLATDERLSAHIARHSYDRLIMLSDGIFAIATTLAALEIKLPQSIREPTAALIAIRRPLAAYAISFAVIAVFWLSSRDLFARVRKVTRALTALTLAMLFTVSLIPLGVAGIAGDGPNAGFRLYALTMTACGVLNAALWCYAAAASGVMRDEVTREYRWTRAIGSLAMPLLFVPMLVLPFSSFSTVVLPYAVGTVVIRRRLLPFLLKRKFAADRAGESVEARALAAP